MLQTSIFKNAILYVMSGTGNTYRLACWMKEIAGSSMLEIKIVMIDEAEAGHSWAVLLYFLASVSVLSYLLYRLGVIYYKFLGFGGSYFYFLIYLLDLFIVLFIQIAPHKKGATRT